MTDRARALHVLDAALDAAERGWFVFPIRPNRKAPAVFSDWEGRATRDRAALRRWFGGSPMFNIGIATGRSNLLVVDIDTPRDGAGSDGRRALTDLAREVGEAVPAHTFRVATPRGEHLYFVAPPGVALRNTTSRLAPCVDTRSAGGYVVGPGSVVAGRRYRVVCPGPPAPVPLWLLNLLRRPQVDRRPPTAVPVASPRLAGYVDAATRGEVHNVAAAAVGTRNQTLFIAAARLGGFVAAGVLPEDNARAALIGACAGHVGVEGFDQAEAERTVESGLRHGTRRPRALPVAPSGARQPLIRPDLQGRAR
jgi:hypothetical protein